MRRPIGTVRTTRDSVDPALEAQLRAIDIATGTRLRNLRTAKRWNQERLGTVVGISYQQIQKYENGTNRISLSTAVLLCNALDCAVSDLVGECSDNDALLDAVFAGVRRLQPGMHRTRTLKYLRAILDITEQTP